jgi:PPOX class probable F420-dependent enzyme
MIDFNGDFGKRVLERLQQEEVIWLVTVDRKGFPQPRPVWFQWDGETILIFSQLAGAKIRHIQRNSKVAVNFNCTPGGGDVVVLLGEATVLEGKIGLDRLNAYISKYRQGIEEIGMTPASFESDYHVAIVVKPTALRGF